MIVCLVSTARKFFCVFKMDMLNCAVYMLVRPADSVTLVDLTMLVSAYLTKYIL